MDIWTGFIIGFFGSVHCVGMCGPIVLMLPGGTSFSKTGYLVSRLLYNVGRMITYSFMGLLVGLIGKSLSLAGFQQVASVAFGVAILVVVLTPGRFRTRLGSWSPLIRLNQHLKSSWAKQLGTASQGSLFTIGILNGFLPCGFVYLGLAGAISTGEIVKSMLYMALFGAGTIPILLATSYAGKIMSLSVRKMINRLIPVGAVIIAVLFILRGLSLGIPYISPKSMMLKTSQHMTVTQNSCH